MNHHQPNDTIGAALPILQTIVQNVRLAGMEEPMFVKSNKLIMDYRNTGGDDLFYAPLAMTQGLRDFLAALRMHGITTSVSYADAFVPINDSTLTGILSANPEPVMLTAEILKGLGTISDDQAETIRAVALTLITEQRKLSGQARGFKTLPIEHDEKTEAPAVAFDPDKTISLELMQALQVVMSYVHNPALRHRLWHYAKARTDWGDKEHRDQMEICEAITESLGLTYGDEGNPRSVSRFMVPTMIFVLRHCSPLLTQPASILYAKGKLTALQYKALDEAIEYYTEDMESEVGKVVARIAEQYPVISHE